MIIIYSVIIVVLSLAINEVVKALYYFAKPRRYEHRPTAIVLTVLLGLLGSGLVIGFIFTFKAWIKEIIEFVLR